MPDTWGPHGQAHAEDIPPEKMQAVIDTTPAWKPDVEALKNLAPGGRLVINAIRKENNDRECLLNLDYARDIWMEKEIRSVANVTRRDVAECLELAARAGIIPEFQQYALEEANLALQELKAKKIRGAKVLEYPIRSRFRYFYPRSLSECQNDAEK